MRKLKMFFMDHWGKMSIVLATIVLIISFVVLLMRLDSYGRNTMLAYIPMYILMGAIQAIVFVGAYMFFFSGGFSKLKKNKVNSSKVNVKFSDVIGFENAKKEALEVVDIIKDSSRVKKIGGKLVKGILLMGPPGCGKTLLAKAIATEAKMPFISIAGSEFVEVFVGVGASRVRKLFKQARKLAYTEGSCIVFIDEIDVIGRGRTFSYMGGGEETNSTQNQLLVEMDGLESAGQNIIVIAATNANENVLDKALLRPGRFDRKIQITLPTLEEREDIFKYYLKKVKAGTDIDVRKLASYTKFKSPAEIENIVKEAALISTRNKKNFVDMDDLSLAMDRVNLGLETQLTMTKREKEMTAYHEAGHAVALYLLHPTDEIFKASLKSRGGALGLVYHTPREELHTQSKEELIADIIVALGGYAAEKIKYGTTSTGVSSDFHKAMAIANAMVWNFGMGTRGLVGDFTAIPKDSMSSKLKEELNTETMEIMNTCLNKVNECLTNDWAIVEDMAQEMLKKEELTYNEVEKLFEKHGKNKVITTNEYIGIKDSSVKEESENKAEIQKTGNIKEEQKKEETEKEEQKTEELKNEDQQQEEPKQEEQKNEEPKREETKEEETKTQE
ncbi:MAG: AAA family ATPase [Elusimicrobia bacterium]|nr:AAA family ATPase [Elusimicrobiota bacterium]